MSRLSKSFGMGAALLAAGVVLAACASDPDTAGSSTSAQPDPVTTLVATSTTQLGPVTTGVANTTTQPAPTTTIDDGTEVTVVDGEPDRQPNSEPTATYTGGACDYDGPSEFDIDTTVTFTFINESDTTDVGFAIFDFPEDLTSEEILELGIFAFVPFGTAEAFTGNPTAIGTPENLTVTFDTPGQWGLNCYDESGNEHGGAGLDYVTMLTVTE